MVTDGMVTMGEEGSNVLVGFPPSQPWDIKVQVDYLGSDPTEGEEGKEEMMDNEGALPNLLPTKVLESKVPGVRALGICTPTLVHHWFKIAGVRRQCFLYF